MGVYEIGVLALMETTVKYHSNVASILTLSHESGQGTVSVGQFDWGGRLLKGNGGAQRFPQGGWQSPAECIGRKGA